MGVLQAWNGCGGSGISQNAVAVNLRCQPSSISNDK